MSWGDKLHGCSAAFTTGNDSGFSSSLKFWEALERSRSNSAGRAESEAALGTSSEGALSLLPFLGLLLK